MTGPSGLLRGSKLKGTRDAIPAGEEAWTGAVKASSLGFTRPGWSALELLFSSGWRVQKLDGSSSAECADSSFSVVLV